MRFPLLVIILLLAAGQARSGVPPVVEHRGSVALGGAPYDGAGRFKFALIEGATGATLWSNDGTSVAGAEPAAAVELLVYAGHYRVLLGDPALRQMSPLPPAVF